MLISHPLSPLTLHSFAFSFPLSFLFSSSSHSFFIFICVFQLSLHLSLVISHRVILPVFPLTLRSFSFSFSLLLPAFSSFFLCHSLCISHLYMLSCSFFLCNSSLFPPQFPLFCFLISPFSFQPSFLFLILSVLSPSYVLVLQTFPSGHFSLCNISPFPLRFHYISKSSFLSNFPSFPSFHVLPQPSILTPISPSYNFPSFNSSPFPSPCILPFLPHILLLPPLVCIAHPCFSRPLHFPSFTLILPFPLTLSFGLILRSSPSPSPSLSPRSSPHSAFTRRHTSPLPLLPFLPFPPSPSSPLKLKI